MIEELVERIFILLVGFGVGAWYMYRQYPKMIEKRSRKAENDKEK